MNRQDARVLKSVRRALPKLSEGVELVVDRMRQGGRLFFVGAGTSGRLGVMEAAECIPTFGIPPGRVIGIIAGGSRAMVRPVEGAEDDALASVRALKREGLERDDVVVGIAASGVTPYVRTAISYARRVGAATLFVTCNRSRLRVDVIMELQTGPEVLTGSTRLKAGTATKMVLNMLTTASFVRLGKCYGNLMVDVRPTSRKLVDRALRIIMGLTGCSRGRAQAALRASGNRVKVAVLMVRHGLSRLEAERRLEAAGDLLRRALCL